MCVGSTVDHRKTFKIIVSAQLECFYISVVEYVTEQLEGGRVYFEQSS